MNVGQLIAELQKHDPCKMVVVDGYEGGHSEATDVTEIRLRLNVNKAWYYGKHEESKEGECDAVSIQ